MINWHLEKKKVSELKNWEENPRTITEKAFKELEKSVEALGNFEPLISNIDGTVIAGNQRLRLATARGEVEVDVYLPDRELTEDEIKEIGVKSNRHSGDWDWDKLANEWDTEKLEEWGMNLKLNTLSGDYSQEVGKVLYEPKDVNRSISELYEYDDRFAKDIQDIENEELRKMFEYRIGNFVKFNFSKIADYYANQATKEEQRVFEKLALILLDKSQLIENGFSKLLKNVIDEN